MKVPAMASMTSKEALLRCRSRHDGVVNAGEKSRAHWRFDHVMGIKRFYRTLAPILALPVVCIAIAGCGAGRPTSHFGEHPVRYIQNDVQILARERLPKGVYLVTAVLRYTFMGRTYSQIGLRYEAPTLSRLTSGRWEGGPSLEPEHGERRTLAMNVSGGCVDSHETSRLAEGLLRVPRDTVTAQGRGGEISFRRVAIPAGLYPDGVFVYALLGPGPADVVTRTPTGRIVGKEAYPGTAACHG
jgi:hypothetical protein